MCLPLVCLEVRRRFVWVTSFSLWDTGIELRSLGFTASAFSTDTSISPGIVFLDMNVSPIVVAAASLDAKEK